MAIGLFFAFWSWSASRRPPSTRGVAQPEKIIPRATLIAVIGLGFLHLHLRWCWRAMGPRHRWRRRSAHHHDLYFGLVQANLGGASRHLQDPVGDPDRSPAPLPSTTRRRATCSHWDAKYPLRRNPQDGERRSPEARLSLHRIRASKRHHAGAGPAIRDFTAVQVPDADGNAVDTPALVPYTNVYGLLALIGTAAILLVQAICSAAVIWYFWVRKTHRGNVITTLVCPLIGGVAMLYVVWRCGTTGRSPPAMRRTHWCSRPGPTSFWRCSSSGWSTRCGCGRPSPEVYARWGAPSWKTRTAGRASA